MITVSGSATAEELAAVLAVLTRESPPGARAGGTDPYERWRAQRLAALRRGLQSEAGAVAGSVTAKL